MSVELAKGVPGWRWLRRRRPLCRSESEVVEREGKAAPPLSSNCLVVIRSAKSEKDEGGSLHFLPPPHQVEVCQSALCVECDPNLEQAGTWQCGRCITALCSVCHLFCGLNSVQCVVCVNRAHSACVPDPWECDDRMCVTCHMTRRVGIFYKESRSY